MFETDPEAKAWLIKGRHGGTDTISACFPPIEVEPSVFYHGLGAGQAQRPSTVVDDCPEYERAVRIFEEWVDSLGGAE